ncbi:MAG TPA: hypothetical protein VGS27_32705 [Candidatus Sulfotelmatobacter sp.]|nr:hypothetical protein [Candidatus Sulfotelmatobacter sp.]
MAKRERAFAMRPTDSAEAQEKRMASMAHLERRQQEQWLRT